jgi:hypothetical protein
LSLRFFVLLHRGTDRHPHYGLEAVREITLTHGYSDLGVTPRPDAMGFLAS